MTALTGTCASPSACSCTPRAGRSSSSSRSRSASARTRRCSPPSTACCCRPCRSASPTARPVQLGRQERHGAELERLRLLGRVRHAERPVDVLVRHVRRTPGRQPDLADLAAGAPSAASTSSSTARRRSPPAIGHRQLLQGAGRPDGPRPRVGEDDDKPSAPPVAVISHGYWQKRFAGEPSAAAS